MLKYFKFMFQSFFSAKYIRKGKCKACGQCCKNILFYAGENPISTEAQFESLKNWDKHYKNFYISGKDETGALLFTCNALGKDNRCRVYLFRGLMCRLYPNANSKFLSNGGQLLEGCGYYFEPDKDFKSFLNIR